MAVIPASCKCHLLPLLQPPQRLPSPPHVWPRPAVTAPTSRRFARLTAAAISTMSPEDASLKKGIAELYDQSSGLWEDIWGDHMHHGFYEPDSAASDADHRFAQIRMIEESLRFAGVSGSPAFFFFAMCFFISLPFKVVAREWRVTVGVCVCVVAEEGEKRPKRVVDVGCGIGGSSRYLAKKYGASCQGITLSPLQAQRAQTLAASQGLADKVRVHV